MKNVTWGSVAIVAGEHTQVVACIDQPGNDKPSQAAGAPVTRTGDVLTFLTFTIPHLHGNPPQEPVRPLDLVRLSYDGWQPRNVTADRRDRKAGLSGCGLQLQQPDLVRHN